MIVGRTGVVFDGVNPGGLFVSAYRSFVVIIGGVGDGEPGGDIGPGGGGVGGGLCRSRCAVRVPGWVRGL